MLMNHNSKSSVHHYYDDYEPVQINETVFAPSTVYVSECVYVYICVCVYVCVYMCVCVYVSLESPRQSPYAPNIP